MKYFALTRKLYIFALENRFNLVSNKFRFWFSLQIYELNLILPMRKKKIIQVQPENVMKIAKAMRVARVTVYNALAYRSESENAQLIRKLAINEYGGVETTRIIL